MCMMFQFYLVIGGIVGLCDSQLSVPKQICLRAGCNVNGTATCKQDVMNNTRCICYPGYSISNKCGEMDECKEHDPCKFGICVNTIGSFRCECLPGKHGDHCNLDDTSFNCTIGYDMVHGNCTDIDECTYRSVNPCARGHCQNTVGSYSCICPPGWTGDRCNNDIQECNNSPCHHGNCTNTRGSFVCNCDPSWTGTLCDTSLTSIVTTSSRTTATVTQSSSAATVIISRTMASTTGSSTSVTAITSVTSKQTSSNIGYTANSSTNVVYSPTAFGNIIRSTQWTSKPTAEGTADPLFDKTQNNEEPLDIGLVAGCVTGGVLAICAGVLIVVLVYQFGIKRRSEIEPDQDTVIEVEQQATNNSDTEPIKPGGHVVGIPRDGGYAMRTRFSIQRLFRQ